MIRQRTVLAALVLGGLVSPAPSGSTLAQLAGVPSSQATPQATRPGFASGGMEINLLRSLQANPATSIYAFSAERRGSKIALRGRVGTKQAHDAAIQTALALGVPVIDDLVIDTLAVHQAAAYQSRLVSGMGYGGNPGQAGPGYGQAGPSSGLGAFPGATSLYTSLPYTYPQPLFGRYDEPFFGFEPPAIGYPAWWGAMTAARVGIPGSAAGGNLDAQPQQSAAPGASMANPPADSADGQAINLPDGTIDMAIDARGVATLRGSVPSLGERITLGQRVAQTPGVTQVVNLLNVKPGMVVAAPLSDKPPPPPVPADSNRPAPAQPSGDAAPPSAPSPNDPTDPVGTRAARAIANRAGLANPSAVKVKVRDGVASLSGKVPTVYEAMLAYRAVQRTPGVREIDDRLEFVVPDGSGPNPLADRGRPEDVEPYLEAQIRRQIGDLAHLDRVRIQGDNLEIKGTLEREDDRTRFEAIMRSMPILRGFRITADVPAESR